MANIYFQTVTSFIIGGQYAAIVNHWIGDDTRFVGSPFQNAEQVISDLENNTVAPGENWPEQLAALMADNCFVSSIRARQIWPTQGNTAVKIYAAIDFPGSYGGDFDAFQTAAVAVWPTQSDTARNGRSFIPGVSTDALVNNRFTDAFTSQFVNLVGQIQQGFSETGVLPLLMAIKHGLSTAPEFDPVIGGFISPTPGNIKKRRIPV